MNTEKKSEMVSINTKQKYKRLTTKSYNKDNKWKRVYTYKVSDYEGFMSRVSNIYKAKIILKDIIDQHHVMKSKKRYLKL